MTTRDAPIPAPAEPQRHCLLGGGHLRLRGNCHCHSTYSDGAHPPEQTVARYRDAKYDFLYLTEHCDKLTYGRFPDFQALDSADFRVLPGVEYRAETVRYGRPAEAMILGLNTLTSSQWKPGIGQQEMIEAINADGGIAILSCTYWDGRSISDMVNLQGVTGIEIYNATCEGVACKGYAVTHWDELLESGMRLYGLAVDDCHFNSWPDFALGWIVVCVDDRTPTAITEAIRTGKFYSSCGPAIEEWSLSGNKITFRCSEVKTIACNGLTFSGRVVRAPPRRDADRMYVRPVRKVGIQSPLAALFVLRPGRTLGMDKRVLAERPESMINQTRLHTVPLPLDTC